MFKSKYPVLPLSKVNKYLPLMEKLKVSTVARSARGFTHNYEKIGGSKSKLSLEWWKKREAFIDRHLAEMKINREGKFFTYKKESVPTRRHLALIAWAYSPTPSKI